MLRVLICDDDPDLAEVMGEFLGEEGVECVITGSLDELKSRRSDVLRCGLAILDVNLGNGRPSGFEAYRWLQSEGFAGRVVFLTGHAAGSPLLGAVTSTGLSVLSKPIRGEMLIQLALQVQGTTP